jgi:hypothetical protein
MPGSSSTSFGRFQTRFPTPPAPVAQAISPGAGPSSARVRAAPVLFRAPALPNMQAIAPAPRQSINPITWAKEFCPTEQVTALFKDGELISTRATLHKALLVGGSTGMTFGVFFNGGAAAVDAVHQVIRGQTPSMGFFSSAAPRNVDAWDLLAGLASYLGGSALSGPGNKIFQTVFAPLVNLITKQIKPKETENILTLKKYNWMNHIEPGWGDEVLQDIANLKDKQRLNSSQTKRLGQAAFALFTLARYVAQSKTALGFGGIVAAGTAVSALSGLCIGAGMTLNASTLTVKGIPKSSNNGGNLRDIALIRGARADVKTRDAQVFKAEYQSVAQRYKATFGAVKPDATNSTGRPVLTLMQRAQALSDGMGLVRSRYMVRAVATIGVAYAVKPFVTSAINNRWAAGAVAGTILDLALYVAVPIWFDYVAKDIPETEKAHRDARNGGSATTPSDTSQPEPHSGSSTITAEQDASPHVTLDITQTDDDSYALPAAAM